MSERGLLADDPGTKALEDLARRVRALEARTASGGSGAHVGSATVDFSTGLGEASVVVTGQSSIAVDAVARAWVGGSTADNDSEAHFAAAGLITCAVESIVAGTGFTIRCNNDGCAATGQFNVYWEWI